MNGKIEELNQKLIPIYSELVSICLEYTESKVDDIYILGINVGNSHFMNNVFFKHNNAFFDKLKIGELGIDSSVNRQKIMINKLIIFLEMYKLFIEYTGESPTEVKLKYNVATGKFGVKLSYSDRIEKSETLGPDDVFNEWFEEAKSGNDGFDW